MKILEVKNLFFTTLQHGKAEMTKQQTSELKPHEDNNQLDKLERGNPGMRHHEAKI